MEQLGLIQQDEIPGSFRTCVIILIEEWNHQHQDQNDDDDLLNRKLRQNLSNFSLLIDSLLNLIFVQHFLFFGLDLSLSLWGDFELRLLISCWFQG